MDMKPTVSDVARNFSDFIDRVAFRGERFLLTRRGKEVAELGPVETGVRSADLPALLRSLPSLGEAEAEAFQRDLDAARDETAGAEGHDPWAT